MLIEAYSVPQNEAASGSKFKHDPHNPLELTLKDIPTNWLTEEEIQQKLGDLYDIVDPLNKQIEELQSKLIELVSKRRHKNI